MKRNKFMLFLLSFAILLGMLSGIQGVVAEENGGGAPAGDYPVVEETLVLQATYGKNDLTEDLKDNQIFKDLEEKTNIQIEWEYISSEWETRKATAFASGDLPDIFFGRGNAPLNDTDIMANKAAFVDMAPLIEEYAPNIKAMFEKDEAMQKIVTTQDGEIFTLPQRMPLRPNTFDVGFINQQWLDNLGLDYPETTEDFKNVLMAFKTEDANGNGDPNDEIPMTFVGTNDLAGFLSLFGSFGITDSIQANYLQVVDGEVQFWPTTENYKEAINYFADLYANGLIDNEAFTQDFGMGTSKYRSSGDPIVGVGFHWTIAAGVTDALADQYVQLLPLEGPNGDRFWRQNPDKVKGGRNYVAISATNPNPAATVRWLDELYNEDISIQLYFGPEGLGTQFNEDGSIDLLPPQDGMTEDSWQWKIGLNDSAPLYVSEEREADIVRNDWVNTKLAYDEAYSEFLRDEWYPFVYWTSEQSSELVSLQTDIHPYVGQMMAQWISGGGVDEGWDAYISQLEAMGLPRLMEIYTEGFEAYQAN